MEYRRLGCSGLKVSAVTMGTMTFGGVGWAKKTGDLGVSEAKRLVDLCLDAGVNLIDTADVYSGGVCEEIIGEILGGKRKGGVLLATNFRGLTDNFVRKAEESSAGLRKLQLWKPERSPAEQVKLARLLAIPFAVIGPVVTVAGIISISHAGIGGSGPGALPDPVRYVVIALAAAAVGWSWLSRRGLFRPAILRGGWRLAVAVLSSLGGLIFGVGIATGQLAIAIAAWAMWLLLRRQRLARLMPRLLTMLVLADLLLFNGFTQGAPDPSGATSNSSTATALASFVTAQGPGPGGEDHRMALFDPDRYDSVQAERIGQPDLTILRALSSVQGYGAVVDANYDHATDTHTQLNMKIDALADNTFARLDLGIRGSHGKGPSIYKRTLLREVMPVGDLCPCCHH